MSDFQPRSHERKRYRGNEAGRLWTSTQKRKEPFKLMESSQATKLIIGQSMIRAMRNVTYLMADAENVSFVTL